MARAPRSDKGKPRAPRGSYKNVPKGLGPFADLRFINRYQLAEAAGYTPEYLDYASRIIPGRTKPSIRIPPAEPDVRDGQGRALWDTHRKDVKEFIATAVAAHNARNAKRLKGD